MNIVPTFFKIQTVLLIMFFVSLFLFPVHATAVGEAQEYAMSNTWTFPKPPNSVKLLAKFENKTITVKKTGGHSWGSTYDLLGAQSKVLGEVKMFTENENLVVTLKPLVDGAFSFGVSVAGEKIRFLDSTYSTPTVSAAGYYPYFFNSSTQVNGGKKPESGTLPQTELDKKGSLFMPGVLLDGIVLVHDDESLYKIKVVNQSGNMQTIFMKQREVGIGRDSVSENIPLKIGDTSTLRIISSDSVKRVQQKRFGSPKKISGTIVQVPFRGWGSTAEGLYLDNSVFASFAEKFKDAGVDHVQIRLNEPKSEIAQIFKDKGLTTHYYIFLGVARERTINGSKCYSLIGRDGARCVNSWLIKNSGGGGFYTPGNESWAFIDIRNPEYRAFLVDQAVYAIENGYEGIFYDGPQLWVDERGRVGGLNDQYNISWYHARAQLLKETKQAIRLKNPNAYLGILGNNYLDYQSNADYVLDEVVTWKEYTDDPRTRKFIYDKKLLNEVLTKYKKVGTNFVLGIKGGSPASVALMHSIAKKMGILSAAKYVDIGDFKTEYATQWANVTAAVASRAR